VPVDGATKEVSFLVRRYIFCCEVSIFLNGPFGLPYTTRTCSAITRWEKSCNIPQVELATSRLIIIKFNSFNFTPSGHRARLAAHCARRNGVRWRRFQSEFAADRVIRSALRFSIAVRFLFYFPTSRLQKRKHCSRCLY